VGSDLFENYHAVTSRTQLASLGLRDGSIMDLNSNSDVLIKDPLHATLNSGEVFLQVVHGAGSHQVQAGSAGGGRPKALAWTCAIIRKPAPSR